MTKEEFEQEMFKWVTFYKERLENAELKRVLLPADLRGKRLPNLYNPFLDFDEKYFNIKLLSNLQAIDTIIEIHPEMLSNQICLFIIGNSKFKLLNDVLNYNTYMVNELKGKACTPIDIAVGYAQYCRQYDLMKNMPRR